MSKLVIVESPTKAKTIGKILSKGFTVLSSFGHVRDLPKNELGVDVEHDFTPKYVIPTASRKKVTELKKAAAKTDEVIFATDEDREGEAISWHLASILNIDKEKAKRVTFHEITKEAIENSFKHPRGIDMNLVDAQQARRILDRLVGYELSPFLWKKVRRGLSAGRVQSVATRLIVDRERERDAFKNEEYWTVDALFESKGVDFAGKLSAHDGKKFGKMDINNETDAKKIIADLNGAEFIVADIIKKEARRSAYPPFRTSTLQQDANKKLGYSAKKTMMLAQQLYEGVELSGEGHIGLITYMRTDSINLSEKFLTDAATYIKEKLGPEFHKRTVFTTKAKGAQEAHEAIRPTEAARTPDSIKEHLEPDQWKIYDLIWRRAVASQMTPAVFDATAIDINAKNYTFHSTGSVIKFPGFLKVYKESREDTVLPDIKTGEKVNAKTIEPKQHFTEPPARYTDATLVKALEEHGIGRPSTYAPTIATIIERRYVERDNAKRFYPTEIAKTVNDILVENFKDIVDLEFTANMEKKLDDIADGEIKWVPVLEQFYGPFHANLKEKETAVQRVTPVSIPTDEKCVACEAPMVIKEGRFGQFLSCSRYPDCKTIKNIEKGTGVKCPQCNVGDIIEKRSRKGRIFFACNKYPDCKFALWNKPNGEKCPTCGSLLVFGAKNTLRCSDKTCGYKIVKEGDEGSVENE